MTKNTFSETDFMATVARQMPTNTSQLERGREVSLGPRGMYTIPFKLTCIYIIKVNIISI